jgi:hypothetical protein
VPLALETPTLVDPATNPSTSRLSQSGSVDLDGAERQEASRAFF